VDNETTPQHLFDALAEYYAPTGPAYVEALRAAGMDDEEIANDYTGNVMPSGLTHETFIAAMERRIAEVTRG
jgi:hypothetical protein